MNGTEYTGHWISTYTGKRFHYLKPAPEEIDIKDIAHALSLTCRFGGHCREFYSVAEHSIRVADEVDRDYKLSALLHDAHEAYLHDVPKPIKMDISGYKETADTIQTAINRRFHLLPMGFTIRHADEVLLATEARDLMRNTEGWATLPFPLEDKIYPWTAEDAELSFLTAFTIFYLYSAKK